MNKIIVTGATGQLGKQTIQSLLQKIDASRIVALVHNESKAQYLNDLGIEIRKGDYEVIESLKTAFKGIDKLFFVSASDLERRLTQHKNVLEVARQSGIKHIVYTSFARQNETDSSPVWAISKSHLYTESFLRESGILYTILRNNLYMEYAPVYMGDKVLENKLIYLPAGEGKVSFLLRNEMAEIAANILASEGHENKSYELASDKAFSYGDIAKMISEFTGKEIKYVSPPVDEFMHTMKKSGVPESMIGMSIAFAKAINEGEFASTNPEISKLLGRKPTSLKEFLKKVYV